MFPLPAFIENNVMMKLRTFASIISEIILTIMGQDVIRDGNMLTIAGQQMSVADECSGLRMVTIFGAMGIAVALLIRRPWWDKLVVLLATLPIALGVNILRIVVTCFLMGNFPGMSEEWKTRIYHDLPGYAMILVAMGLLLLLIKILEKLSVQEEAVNLRGAGFAGVR
jgi:exosortase